MTTWKSKLLWLVGALTFAAAPVAAQGAPHAELQSIAHAVTPPLASYVTKVSVPPHPHRIVPLFRPAGPLAKGGGGGGGAAGGGGSWIDNDLQGTGTYGTSLLTLGTPFQGMTFGGGWPPDPNISVGVNSTVTPQQTQILQIVNATAYAVYDSSGNTLLPPTDLLTLFGVLPTTSLCASVDGGDPIALFDKRNQRWIISQLAYNSDFSQNEFCLAISTSSNATGTYHVYDIPFGSHLPDYPKLAAWVDGVYLSANIFTLRVNPITGAISSKFLGAQGCRVAQGDVISPPTTVPLTLTCTPNPTGTLSQTSIYNVLPADLEGTALSPSPSSTTPEYYLQFLENLSGVGSTLMLYQFGPETSYQFNAIASLLVSTYHAACGGGTCIPQSGSTQLLDSIGDRLMYRLSYRSYSDTSQKMVINHSVQISSASQQTGIRWYELCKPSGGTSFSVCKESTFSPDNSLYRWMGSIAQDACGNIGMGYSTSSATAFPSVAVAGKLSSESGMEQERLMYAGQGPQDLINRWGDYTSISVDPSDDTTFWYTNEYYPPENSIFPGFNILWNTVIGKFKFSTTCP